MSEATAAPAQEAAAPAAVSAEPSTAAAPAQDAGRALSRGERIARAREAVSRQPEAASTAAPVAEESAPATTESAEKPSVAEATPAPAAPPENPAEVFARVLQERLSADRKAFEAEQQMKAAQSQAAKLQQELEAERARLAELAKDPFRKAVLDGRSYAEITEDFVKNKYDPPTPEQLAMQKHEQTLQAERERIQAIEKRLQEEDARKDFERRHGTVKEKLVYSADKYPFAGALGWMSEIAVRNHQARESQGADLDSVLEELNSAVEKDLHSVFSSDAALSRLLSDETLRTRVIAKLGLAATPTPSQPAAPASAAPNTPPPAKVPAAIPSRVVGESGARVSSPMASRGERIANALKAAQQASR